VSSQDAAATVRELYTQARKGNHREVSALLSADVEWHPVPGHKRLKPALDNQETTQALLWRGRANSLRASEVIPVGDRVVVKLGGRRLGLLGASGWRAQLYQVVTLRGGVIVRLEDYSSRAEALASVGLQAGRPSRNDP
jgi:ketosteroid isomerase-like protein